ncbi:hypothetical protein Clacol_008689 [Clathrus columnatus]|uniref:Protein MON2 homolog n=1 Tax=Clathrus columnatus TaxID=1419009 RepID=A0AAV5ARB9_9AGAM|nr:hypothetical protein Clacol_008689 [Clathrus columnatus]
MSSLAFLVTELQSLASETRRKHPEIREAAEKSLAILRSSPEQANVQLTTKDGSQSEDLLRPVFMGCATRNPKVIAISLGSLQRLISLKAVPLTAVPLIVSIMNDCISQGVDIQLRILQTLLSLITNFPDIHDTLLGDALLVCFKLQESKIAVVSSTAGATLRQLLMFVVDKVLDEDRLEASSGGIPTVLPDGNSVLLRPSAKDAFSVFEDLCLLANSEKSKFLKLDSLPKTFAMELIESTLTNYHNLFHKQFLSELPTESEVFFMLLIKVVSGDNDGDMASSQAPRPSWMRVIALEAIRGLCTDGELMRKVWQLFDANEGSSKVFGTLLSVLKRLSTEKPALLGISPEIMGLGVTSHSAEGSALYEVAGMVANAASATVSGVASMIVSETGLSVGGSTDSPPIPESYIYLLALQCLVILVEGFASLVLPLYNSIAIVRPRAAGESVIHAPPALDLSSLPPEEHSTIQLRAVYSMLDQGWPPLLAALSFYISTNLSDDLFADVVVALQGMINVTGALNLTTPRDAFLVGISKFAVPTRVVSSLDSFHEPPPTPKNALSVENLGLSGLTGAHTRPGLSERNLACLKVLISSSMFLAGSLGSSWFDVLETLQNADYVLTKGATYVKKPGPNPNAPAATRHLIFTDLDPDTIHNSMKKLIDSTKLLDDLAFRDFLTALCKLSSEMVGMQVVLVTDEVDPEVPEEPNARRLSTPSAYAHRRRASGIALTRTMRGGDFGISKLGIVCLLNTNRLLSRDADIAWNIAVNHLLAVIGHPQAPASIRLQAAQTLNDILNAVPRNLANVDDIKAEVQERTLKALAREISVGNMLDIRRMGLETLHQILQSSAHSFVTGWEIIFDTLGKICKPHIVSDIKPLPSESDLSVTGSDPILPRRPSIMANEKGNLTLVRIAFQSLTLVCDTLSALSPEHLRTCIKTLGLFGKQADTNIALTAAASLMWSVSDSIQSQRKDAEKEPEYSALWMSLLLELLGLCTDTRHEVRVGAIQTLFRSLQLYGATLSLETWTECISKIIFPLLDSLTTSVRAESLPTAASNVPENSWDESKILALQSLSSLFSDFMTLKMIHLTTFLDIWDTVVLHVKDSFFFDSRSISTAALRCLERALESLMPSATDSTHVDVVDQACEKTWSACVEMGDRVTKHTSPTSAHSRSQSISSDSTEKIQLRSIPPFSQDSLLAFLDVIKKTREVSKSAVVPKSTGGSKTTDGEWALTRLETLVSILKTVVTYSGSPEYRPDVNSLTPVQSAFISIITSISFSIPASPSLLLSDISSYAALPFLAAFDVPPPHSSVHQNGSAKSSQPLKRVTYIGLSKKIMPMIVDWYLKFKDTADIYADGTVETILSAYSIPIKLKYDCPPSSKSGSDLPLWKTATTCFLRIVKECSFRIGKFGANISDAHIEASEENFDLSVLATLEIDIIPHLGSDPRIPDNVIGSFGKALERASMISVEEEEEDRSAIEYDLDGLKTVNGNGHVAVEGRSRQPPVVPRERFSYWCLDLLFLICSDVAKDRESSRRRVAALCLPSLLKRCSTVLANYVADCKLRKDIPVPRHIEEELLYVLRKLLETKLWSGTLWAALQEKPSEVANVQPAFDLSLSLPEIMQLTAQRSTMAHLFHFYPVLLEIAVLPNKPATLWMMPSLSDVGETTTIEVQGVSSKASFSHIGVNLGGKAEAVEVDSRKLAGECLALIGKEFERH